MISTLAPNTYLQNRYQIACLLKQGGMGAVYQAWDLRLPGRVVAVKENFDNSPAAQAQFQTEAALLANLNHPALPRVTDYFIEASGRQYLVMDYVEGNDLEEIVTRQGRVAETRAVPWIVDVLDALEYLHTRQPPVIHRDIKPANIKIRPDGKAILVDFGIAKVYDPTQKTRAGARAVTPGYAPTEQYGYGITDARSDIYAVGATFYFVLTGQVPPEATDLAANLRALTPPSWLGVPINPQVERAILKAMAIAPQQRFQSAREFRAALTAQVGAPSVMPLPKPATVTPSTSVSPQVAPVALPRPRLAPSRGGVTPPSSLPASVSVPATVSVVYASWGRRALAQIADWVLLFIVFLLCAMPAAVLDSSSTSSAGSVFTGSVMCFWLLGSGVYFTLCHTYGGQTIGKKIVGIKVVTQSDQRVPNLGRSILRTVGGGIEWFIALISTKCLFIGFAIFLLPLLNKKKQALHDVMAGTIVIRT